MNSDDLKKKLTPEQFHVTQEKGTESRFSPLWDNKQNGMYTCVVCGTPLFSSHAKFELDPTDWNYGWPSFDDPVSKDAIELRDDNSHGMHRTEVVCKHCGAHLGHLFTDGPKETTGNHYCVNACALTFTPDKK